MNKANSSMLWKVIQKAGDDLNGQLRIIQTTQKVETLMLMLLCVKEKFNASYKDIPDEKFDEVVNFIKFFKNKTQDNLLLRKIIF